MSSTIEHQWPSRPNELYLTQNGPSRQPPPAQSLNLVRLGRCVYKAVEGNGSYGGIMPITIIHFSAVGQIRMS